MRNALHLIWELLPREAALWQFLLFRNYVGISRPWIIDPVPGEVSKRHFTTLYGRFSELPAMPEVLKDKFSVEIDFLEVL